MKIKCTSRYTVGVPERKERDGQKNILKSF